ncbi:TPA: DUF2974 domain-containing protein, partial [Enterococcus faecium]
MDQNKEFSKTVYGVETGKVKVNEKIVEDKYLVIDVIDTDKHTIEKEKTPKKNGMQAMVVAEIKDKYKG